MKAEELFKGTALVIDDELDDEHSDIVKIVKSIKENGGNVIERKVLPSEEADLTHFVGMSFVVMDWNLHGEVTFDDAGGVQQISLPKALVKQHDEEKVQFLSRLATCRLAPIFIFTAGPLDEVKTRLAKARTLSYAVDQPSHILVMSKSDVLTKGLFGVLGEWLQETPSALALKTWEHEYEKAKNAAFLDFYTKSVYWPVMLWDAFKQDDVPPSDELGRLITRIIFSRMTPFNVDLDSFVPAIEQQQKQDSDGYRKDLLKVLEAERFVSKSGLHEESIAPGDVFKDGDKFLINIRPDCDCVARDGAADAIEMYLLVGKKASAGDLKKLLDRERGTIREREDQAAVFAMYDQKTVVFSLKELRIETWGDLKGKRVGRLLAPFLTRLQQRYSAYLQRPGLPKIPSVAMPDETGAVGNAAVAVQTAKEKADSEPGAS